MERFFWVLTILLSVVWAHPGHLEYRRLAATPSGAPFPTNASPTAAIGTGSYASGSSFHRSKFNPSSLLAPFPTNVSSSAADGIGSHRSGGAVSRMGSESSRLSAPFPTDVTPTTAIGTGSNNRGNLFSSSKSSSSNHPPQIAFTTSSSATITAPAVLPTRSILSLSTDSTSIAGITSNTQITTDKDGHHTTVPFLWDCWFCGGGGLLLWNVGPLPGIYPPPIPPPFPSWPSITIGNDNLPTPDSSKKNDPTNSANSQTEKPSPTSSSSSCTESTVTDYWVSCASVTSGTSICSTFSSSLATGCSATPVTSTTISACTAPPSITSESLLPGESHGPEYDTYDPAFSDAMTDWSYTVAVLASSGVVGMSSTSQPTTSVASTSTSIASSTAPPPPPASSTSPPPPPPPSSSSSPPPPPPPSSSPAPAPPSQPPAQPAPPPAPTASCGWLDQGWGYTFRVYDISGWATDGGDSLHNQEDGCGALTGWRWEGNTAFFNLPYLIKDGCVESAIATAGGPQISCNQDQVGPQGKLRKRAIKRREYEVRAVSHDPDKAWSDVAHSTPDFEDAAIVRAYNPPGVDLSAISHTYKTAAWRKRSDITHATPDFTNTAIANAYRPPGVDLSAISHSYKAASWDKRDRSLGHDDEKLNVLRKRGCIPSKQTKLQGFGPANYPGTPPPESEPLVCNPIIPGVDQCNEQVAAHGNAGKKVSLFYTGWEANGAPGVGQKIARVWARQNMCNEQIVTWAEMHPKQWALDVQKAIVRPFEQPGMNSDELHALNAKADPFLKNLAQAFAEKSANEVYVFIPKGRLENNQWNKDSAWGGWEYPALTANPDVKRISRVDVDVSDADNPKGTTEVIWDREKGDGKADYKPKGIRGPSLPADLPADQVPEGWQQSL